ncbi:MAG: endonuclease/exonuclease/phosphatase family protein [Planctomycetota bacterium]|jgi:endonuclease/exonuclease/phosphatase family metal-dependent hydrolase
MRIKNRLRQLVCCVLAVGATGCQSALPVPDDPLPLRIMSYNIRHGEGQDGRLDLERTAAVIADARPDLVALQEVDVGARRTGSIDQAARLAELTGMDHRFGAFMEYDGGEYGLAVLSRIPIRDAQVIRLPPGRHEPRSALAVTVGRSPSAPPLVFVCVHFDWLADDTARHAQATELVRQLDAVSGPVVVAGDFNDEPGSRVMTLILQHWTNASKPPDGRMTFPSVEPDREIDYIVSRPDSQVRSSWCRVIDERVASDHRPVLAELVVQP